MKNVNRAALDQWMQPLFGGDTVRNESVMFIDKGDIKELLYPIDKILSVTSYDCTKTYVEGVDYEVVDGKLKATENTTMPIITGEVYYNYTSPEPEVRIQVDGKDLFWGEYMTQPYQVNVTYTHSTAWEGYAQACRRDVFDAFIKKLEAGEDVTVLFCGDSITYGANSSWLADDSPKVYPYTLLFTHALADLYGYTVRYEDYSFLELPIFETCPRVPTEHYVAGTRGTITYVNTAMGGWATFHGVEHKQLHLCEPVAAHGCDLLVLAFGMNDIIVDPTVYTREMIDTVLAIKPDAAVAVVSTMVPNPTSNWDNAQRHQEPYLLDLAEQMRGEGKQVAVACMTSVSNAILKKKTFNDYTGNNINHPNDFMCRLYAQTLLQTVIGYENMQ